MITINPTHNCALFESNSNDQRFENNGIVIVEGGGHTITFSSPYKQGEWNESEKAGDLRVRNGTLVLANKAKATDAPGTTVAGRIRIGENGTLVFGTGKHQMLPTSKIVAPKEGTQYGNVEFRCGAATVSG